MKKLIALFTIAVSTATMASNPYSADTAVIFDHYKNVIQQTPYRVEVCQDRLQPAGDGSATNELVGALFGGAIGNQFGNGDGKDASHKNGKIVGFEDEGKNRSRNGKGSTKRKKIKEEHGAGDMGTTELLLKYLMDTPYSGIDGYDFLKNLNKRKHDKKQK